MTHALQSLDKLTVFLAGIMSAIEHLQGLVFESWLVAQDTTVAQASGWAGFAQFTTAGRMLPACNAQTISAYEAAITASCQPFAHTTIHAWLRRGQPSSAIWT